MTDDLHGPSILALTETPPSGCTLWRIFTVFERLEQRRYMAHHAPLQDRRLDAVAPYYDALMLPRVSWKAEERHLGEHWFGAMHRAGKAVIFECDDDIFTPATVQRIHETRWEDGRTHEQLDQERLERIWAMQQCDGVTVSTQRLTTIVRQYTERPVRVVPNAIDIRWFREVLLNTPREVPGLTVGWAGGRRPDADVDAMAEAWGRIARRYPQVTFIVQGWQPEVISECVPEERIFRIPWLPLAEYPQGLRQVDIGCCAVADTRFNQAKSSIKAMEYAVAGAAVVASPLLYAGIVDHGGSGFIAENADEWEDGISQLIESPSLRSMMARRLLKTVEKKHSLDGNLWRWPAAWADIVADFRERQPTAPRILVPSLRIVRPNERVLSGVA